MSHWLTTSLLAYYSLLSLLCNVQAQDSTASVRRVNAKFEVTLSDGNPFVGTVTLKDSSNDVVYLYTNRFGLGFAQLRPDSEYSVSVDGFPQFSHFGTVPISQGVMEIELVLPPAALKGISAKEGYGLVLFSYLNVMGHPVANRLLYCKSEDGELYTGITNAAGKARVEVPLGHTYQFSVDGTPNFDSHTFTSYPPLQTAEIKLELNKTTVIKHSILPRVPDNASDKAKEAPSNKKKSAPVYRTHKDSIRGAKKRINPPRAKKILRPLPFLRVKRRLQHLMSLNKCSKGFTCSAKQYRTKNVRTAILCGVLVSICCKHSNERSTIARFMW